MATSKLTKITKTTGAKNERKKNKTTNGIIAIIGYNYGARMKARVYQCIRVALYWAITIMLIGTILFMVFPGAMMSIFESEAEAEGEAGGEKEMMAGTGGRCVGRWG